MTGQLADAYPPSAALAPQSLISCIMPTANRRAFVPQAIACFMRQSYAQRELIVVDDGVESVADLIPADPRIRYLRLAQPASVGAKRNLACAEARGALIAHWDDDDWHAPTRLAVQAAAMDDARAELCGLTTLLFYEPAAARAWRYQYPAGLRPWLAGSSLCYRRSFWVRRPFPRLNVGEDARFVWGAPASRLRVLPSYQMHVGLIHAGNVSPKRTTSAYWQPYPLAEIAALLGDDMVRYNLLAIVR